MAVLAQKHPKIPPFLTRLRCWDPPSGTPPSMKNPCPPWEMQKLQFFSRSCRLIFWRFSGLPKSRSKDFGGGPGGGPPQLRCSQAKNGLFLGVFGGFGVIFRGFGVIFINFWSFLALFDPKNVIFIIFLVKNTFFSIFRSKNWFFWSKTWFLGQKLIFLVKNWFFCSIGRFFGQKLIFIVKNTFFGPKIDF